MDGRIIYTDTMFERPMMFEEPKELTDETNIFAINTIPDSEICNPKPVKLISEGVVKNLEEQANKMVPEIKVADNIAKKAITNPGGQRGKNMSTCCKNCINM